MQIERYFVSLVFGVGLDGIVMVATKASGSAPAVCTMLALVFAAGAVSGWWITSTVGR